MPDWLSGEDALIRQCFSDLTSTGGDVALGGGDDCALLRLPGLDDGRLLAVSVDSLHVGVHFPEDGEPKDIGWRALTTALSDLAAMGATPAWCTLALSLEPDRQDKNWLRRLSEGFSEACTSYGVRWVGGDTTKARLSLSVQVAGWVDERQALRRDGAKPGDCIGVTGCLGAGYLGLQLWQQQQAGEHDRQQHWAVERFWRPQPRIQVGQAIGGLASAAMDISDGLALDARRMAQASQVQMQIDSAALPLALNASSSCPQPEGEGCSDTSATAPPTRLELTPEKAATCGDDYELLFTCSPGNWPAVQAAVESHGVRCTQIGQCLAVPVAGVPTVHVSGLNSEMTTAGWDPFTSAPDRS